MDAYVTKIAKEDLSRRGRSRARWLARGRGRLTARLRAAKLDRALAAGASPNASPALALRAEALSSQRTRRELGDTLEELLAKRWEPHPLGARVSPRHGVDATREELWELARRLRADQPADARGVARARELLSDGAGPLFWSRSDADLRTMIRAAIAALDPQSDRSRGREAS